MIQSIQKPQKMSKAKSTRSKVTEAKTNKKKPGRKKIEPVPRKGPVNAALMMEAVIRATFEYGNEWGRVITRDFNLDHEVTGVTINRLLQPESVIQQPARDTVLYIAAYCPSYPHRAEKKAMDPLTLLGWWVSFIDPDKDPEWEGWKDWLDSEEFVSHCEHLRLVRSSNTDKVLQVKTRVTDKALERLEAALEHTLDTRDQTESEFLTDLKLPKTILKKLRSGESKNPEGVISMIAPYIIAESNGTFRTFEGGTDLLEFLNND